MILFKNLGRFIILNYCFVLSGLVFAADSISRAIQLTPQQYQVYAEKGFHLHGIIQIDRHTSDGKLLAEFSGLAWDHDENILYALSDRGYLVHLEPAFSNGNLTSVSLKDYHNLQDEQGKLLSGINADSEGLALLNSNNKNNKDTELVISFERRPRIINYTPEGRYLKQQIINNRLSDITNYSGSNKSLEAITEHKNYNIVFAPERPLKNSEYLIPIHSTNNKDWHFLPDNKTYGSLVGLTTLPDNRIVALERSFPGLFAGLTTTVHLLELSDYTIEQKTLFQLKPADGYFNDNFEGITWHKEKRFFMISDNNNNPLQRSLLIYFEIANLE